jgi:ATP-dependent Clp protease ATP-binding subunit ClpC
LLQILDLFIKGLSVRLMDHAMTIELSQAAKERLIEVGFEPALGARPLRRAVQREIEDALSEKILEGELAAGDHVEVDFVDGEFTFRHGPREEDRAAIGAGVGGALTAGPATADHLASGN